MKISFLMFALICQIVGLSYAGDELRVIGPKTQLAKSDCSCINSGDIIIDKNDRNAIVCGLRGNEWIIESFPLDSVNKPKIITTSTAWLGRPQSLGDDSYVFLSEEISSGQFGLPQAVQLNSISHDYNLLTNELYLINDFKIINKTDSVMDCELLHDSLVLNRRGKPSKIIKVKGKFLKLESVFNKSLIGYWYKLDSHYNFAIYDCIDETTKHVVMLKDDVYNLCVSSDLTKIYYVSASDDTQESSNTIMQINIATGKTEPIVIVKGKIAFLSAGDKYLGCTFLTDLADSKYETILIDLKLKKSIPLCKWWKN